MLYKQGVGIALDGVGNRASHNLIHDGPRMGIMFSGNNLVIEYNHVRHMNLETEDTGAVYTGGRDWISSRGTVIRYNLFHDMLGFGKDEHGRWVSPHFAWGVYLDDNTGGVDVIGNIVYRCSRAGLHLHNGRDNHIFNNVFVDNGPQQYEYSGWTKNHSYWKDHLPTMIKGYERVASSPAWKSMRNMNVHPRDAVLPDGLIMTGNEFTRNIIAYHAADAALVRTNDVPFDHNVADFNLVWHHGLPIKTGQRKPGKDISGNLAPNGDFLAGRSAACRRSGSGRSSRRMPPRRLVEEDGRRALRIDAAFDTTKPRDNYPIVVSREFAARPGHAYRIKARLKATAPEVEGRPHAPGLRGQRLLLGQLAQRDQGRDRLEGPRVRVPDSRPRRARLPRADETLPRPRGFPVPERGPPGRRRLAARDRDAGRMGVVAGPGHGSALEGRRPHVRRPRSCGLSPQARLAGVRPGVQAHSGREDRSLQG